MAPAPNCYYCGKPLKPTWSKTVLRRDASIMRRVPTDGATILYYGHASSRNRFCTLGHGMLYAVRVIEDTYQAGEDPRRYVLSKGGRR